MSLRNIWSGFSPSVVGLENQEITGWFGDDRPLDPKCAYHKGIDISTRGENDSRPQLQFVGGMFGRVEIPGDSDWNTITVYPFSSKKFYVQFLHSSSRLVNTGDVVAPWTPLGITGEVGAPGQPHLHVHVVQWDDPGQFEYDCFDRCYVDPISFELRDHLAGIWRWTHKADNRTIVEEIEFGLTGDDFTHSRSVNGRKEFTRLMSFENTDSILPRMRFIHRPTRNEMGIDALTADKIRVGGNNGIIEFSRVRQFSFRQFIRNVFRTENAPTSEDVGP